MKFPMFVDIENKKILVVGGGNVGLRRIGVLKDFKADITLVSDRLEGEVPKGIRFIYRAFEDSDIDNYFFVIAATDNRAVNRRIYELCSEKGIPVSVCDCPEESTFFFPAVCKNDVLSVGVVSDGSHHELVSKTAEKIRSVIN